MWSRVFPYTLFSVRAIFDPDDWISGRQKGHKSLSQGKNPKGENRPNFLAPWANKCTRSYVFVLVCRTRHRDGMQLWCLCRTDSARRSPLEGDSLYLRTGRCFFDVDVILNDLSPTSSTVSTSSVWSQPQLTAQMNGPSCSLSWNGPSRKKIYISSPPSNSVTSTVCEIINLSSRWAPLLQQNVSMSNKLFHCRR